jgi:hypothetical protein
VLGCLAALYIAVGAPWQHAHGHGSEQFLRFVAIGGCALAAAVATPRRWWWARLLVVAASSVAIGLSEGRLVALWVAAGLILAAWVTADRPPLPTPRHIGPGVAAAEVVVSVVAVQLGKPTGTDWQPLAALGVGLLIAGLGSIGPTALGQAVRASGRRLEVAAETVLLVPVFVVYAVARSVRFAVVAPPQRAVRSAAWRSTGDAAIDARSRRSLATESWRRRRWVLPVLCTAAVALTAYTLVDRFGLPDVIDRTSASAHRPTSARAVGLVPTDEPVPAAYRGDTWYPSFRRDMAWALDEKVAWRPLQVQRVLDVRTDTVNVTNGRRRTWEAPRCSCRRLTVWLYGGSGAFGMGQRDEHTIASELARAASADGITVDVQNRGVPGELHWRNATRFSWDLTQDRPPDLVVFYDGAEEVQSVLDLHRRGLGDVRAPFESFVSDLYDDITVKPLERPPDGVETLGWPSLDTPPTSLGELAVQRYERARQTSEGTAKARDVPVRYFWQPSRFDVDPSARPAGGDAAQRAEAYRKASAALPPDVERLDGAFSASQASHFYDDTNHDERTARIVAGEMWRDLRQQIRSLARGAGR